jgi:hypothetical protein
VWYPDWILDRKKRKDICGKAREIWLKSVV